MNPDLQSQARLRRRLHSPARRRLGEWPAVLVVLLSPVLWLLWPRAAPPSAPAPLLPEAGAAYVRVDWSDNPLTLRPDRLAHPAGDGFRHDSGLPPMPAPALPAVPPPPPYLTPTALATPPHDPPPAPIPLPPLIANPVANPPPPAITGTPPARVWLSPPLQAARFAFDPPPGLATQAPGRVRLHLSLDGEGRVSELLVEEQADPASARAWRTALLRGAGLTQAVGRVEAEWGG